MGRVLARADEFFEDGDTVVVLGHTDVKKGDQSAKLPVVHIWRFRGDDEVCRLQILTDTLHGARAPASTLRAHGRARRLP